MDVSSDNDFLEYLLKSMIQGTGLPVNYIDASQEVEFSRNLAMQSSIFVEEIVNDQSQAQTPSSKLLQKLFYNEYQLVKMNNNIDNKEDTLSNININDLNIIYPTPISLNLTNQNDQISNSSSKIDFVTNIYFDENSADENMTLNKFKFRKNVAREVLPNLEWDKWDDLFNKSNIEGNEERIKNDTGNDDDMDDEDY